MAELEQRLHHIWQTRGVWAWVLYPLSLLYRVVVFCRRMAYRLGWFKTGEVAVPVIVVGNIFIGGTGKTPLVIWMVDALRQRGLNPGVISRGHVAESVRQRHDEVRSVTADADVRRVGDEPLLIRLSTDVPVFVGRDRVAAANALLKVHPEVNVLISDDGLQHYALPRAVELVLSDQRGDGNGWLLPAGPLREPVRRPRDFTVLHYPSASSTDDVTDDGGKTFVMRLGAPRVVRLSDWLRGGTGEALAIWRDDPKVRAARIAALAGIGHPQRFFDMLMSYGLDIDARPLPDHYSYQNNPFPNAPADIILITEKDAVKCGTLPVVVSDTRVYVVSVVTGVSPRLADLIVAKLKMENK